MSRPAWPSAGELTEIHEQLVTSGQTLRGRPADR